MHRHKFEHNAKSDLMPVTCTVLNLLNGYSLLPTVFTLSRQIEIDDDDHQPSSPATSVSHLINQSVLVVITQRLPSLNPTISFGVCLCSFCLSPIPSMILFSRLSLLIRWLK